MMLREIVLMRAKAKQVMDRYLVNVTRRRLPIVFEA